MPFGIVLKGSEPVESKANFYVPSINSNDVIEALPQTIVSHVLLKTQSNSPHELLAELAQMRISSDVIILIHLPSWATIDEMYQILIQSERQFSIIVPILDNMNYHGSLRDLFKTPSDNVSLILSISKHSPRHLVNRYRCLRYVAVYITEWSDSEVDQIYDDVASLMRKRNVSSLLLDKTVCQTATFQFWRSMSEQKLKLHSDVLIDPLQPLTVDLELDVYETFEKDRTKYSQYRDAIEMAISDLAQQHNSLKIMIIGPGRGPLLEMVMELARKSDRIVAVEKNTKCIQNLERWHEKRNFELITDDVRNLGRDKLGTFHLVISELLGSFGCNEAAPEILSIFEGLSPVMIPQEVQSYVQAIYTDVPLDKCANRPYLVKLSSFCTVSDPLAVFTFTHPGTNDLNQQKQFTLSAGRNEISNGFHGYFEAVLYGPYKIGIRPNQGQSEYCDSWFPILFPIPETKMPFDVKFMRSSSKSLTYSWEVNGQLYGQDYFVDLG